MLIEKRPKSYNVISIDIDNISYSMALNKILDAAEMGNYGFVCFANVHMVIEAYWKKEFREKLENAKLILADGLPVSKSLKLLYGIRQERIAGMDFINDLMKDLNERRLGVFVIGSTSEVVDNLSEVLKTSYEDVQLKGHISPPLDGDWNNDEYINEINESGAKLVLVSLGCPKQELWMASHYKKINAVMLGIGGALPVFAGVQKRCPGWISKLGLEWLYRFTIEPKRLFKRYSTTNPVFIWLFLKQFFQNKFQS